MTDWQLYEGRAQDLLPGDLAGQVNLIVTSPPYDGLRNFGGHAADFDFAAIAGALVACLAPGGTLVWVVADAVVNGSETGTSFRQALGFMELGLRLHQTLIYARRGGPISGGMSRCRQPHDYMFVLTNGAPAATHIPRDRENIWVTTGVESRRLPDGSLQRRRRNLPDGSLQRRRRNLSDKAGLRNTIWTYDPGFRKCHPGEGWLPHEHPATYPYQLAADHIRCWSNPGDLVLDPMAGSGTTLRAAVDRGRRAVGVEVNPAYCGIIRRRMAQAVLIAPEV